MSDLAAALKEHLRAWPSNFADADADCESGGYYGVVDWDELDAAIDAFAATFGSESLIGKLR